MSTSGWIFMVGFRVLDVGMLAAWLFWFFRRLLDDDGDDDDWRDEDDRAPEPFEPPPAPPGASRPPKRLRDHGDRMHPDRVRAGRRVPATEVTREGERTLSN